MNLTEMTTEQLRQLNRRVCYELKHRSNQVKNSFSVGEPVEFTHTKTGVVHRGTIIKIMPKNIKVQVPTGAEPSHAHLAQHTNWTVSPNLLRSVK